MKISAKINLLDADHATFKPCLLVLSRIFCVQITSKANA